MEGDWDPRIAHVEIQGDIRELATRIDGRLERLEMKLDERLEAIRSAIDSGDRASLQAVAIIDGTVKRLEADVKANTEQIRRLTPVAENVDEVESRVTATETRIGLLERDRAKLIGVLIGVGVSGGLAGGGIVAAATQVIGG